MEGTAQKFTHVFLDNDGLLVDTERVFFESTRQILKQVGITFTLERFIQLNLVENKGGWSLAREKGIDEEKIQKLREERDRLYEVLLSEGGFLIEGVGEVLDVLSRHVALSVVTTSKRVHYEAIHSVTGYRPYFQFELVREDYDRSKPDPDPYLLALERSGADASSCLVLEDSERGLLAAKAAGMECWVVPGVLNGNGNFGEADRVLGSITEIPAALGINLVDEE